MPAEKDRINFTNNLKKHEPLVEGKDYYIEQGLFVFTSDYHKKRGYCCKSGCRHCPYQKKCLLQKNDAID